MGGGETSDDEGHVMGLVGPVRSGGAEGVVREFWRLMATNDFGSVAAVLAEDLVVEWPQSGERFRGPRAFAQVNSEYPTAGRWAFTVNRVVACGEQVVTQVSVTDGVQSAEPISFFTVRAGRIVHLVEYWPEPFAPPAHRRHLAEPKG
jgi:ketosteroid isomerase-like protein